MVSHGPTRQRQRCRRNQARGSERDCALANERARKQNHLTSCENNQVARDELPVLGVSSLNLPENPLQGTPGDLDEPGSSRHQKCRSMASFTIKNEFMIVESKSEVRLNERPG